MPATIGKKVKVVYNENNETSTTQLSQEHHRVIKNKVIVLSVFLQLSWISTTFGFSEFLHMDKTFCLPRKCAKVQDTVPKLYFRQEKWCIQTVADRGFSDSRGTFRTSGEVGSWTTNRTVNILVQKIQSISLVSV